MSNAPERFEIFLIPDGEKRQSSTVLINARVKMDMDTKIPNAATFTFLREDHTLGNILRSQLLKNPRVLFAGYKVPHPLEHAFQLKIQTTPESSPREALVAAIDKLKVEYSDIQMSFENCLRYAVSDAQMQYN